MSFSEACCGWCSAVSRSASSSALSFKSAITHNLFTLLTVLTLATLHAVDRGGSSDYNYTHRFNMLYRRITYTFKPRPHDSVTSSVAIKYYARAHAFIKNHIIIYNFTAPKFTINFIITQAGI